MADITDIAHDEYVITNVTVVDPEKGETFPGHVGVREGKIAFVGKGAPDGGDTPQFDGGGLHLAPGFVDIHVHLREPGFEYKETVASGSKAAAAGGFTSIACMPNTDPAIDERSVVEFILKQARIAGAAKVYPIAAATVGRKGKQLTEFFELADAGAVAVSDDGSPVATAGMARRVMEMAARAGLTFIEHCEDMSASGAGVMHEGYYSTKLGLGGIPAHSEEVCLSRDLIILESAPCRFHGAHMSTRGSVELLRRAKERGLPVTAETAPHYLCLLDKDVETFNTSLKINPPLRAEEDREALIAALKNGTIDCIASDHAPHAAHEKQVEFAAAPPGSIGLETTFAVVNTHLVAAGHMSLPEAIALITHKPARALGITGGTLMPGEPADLVLFDPAEEWMVHPGDFRSKSKNSAYVGMTLTGRTKHTILDGAVVFSSVLTA